MSYLWFDDIPPRTSKYFWWILPLAYHLHLTGLQCKAVYFFRFCASLLVVTSGEFCINTTCNAGCMERGCHHLVWTCTWTLLVVIYFYVSQMVWITFASTEVHCIGLWWACLKLSSSYPHFALFPSTIISSNAVLVTCSSVNYICIDNVFW